MSLASLIVEMLSFLLSPLRDRFYHSLDKKRERKFRIYVSALDRIRQEKPNISRILTAVPYRSELHRRAVEEDSFTLLEKEIANLRPVLENRKVLKQVGESLASKDARKLISDLTLLENDLNGRLK